MNRDRYPTELVMTREIKCETSLLVAEESARDVLGGALGPSGGYTGGLAMDVSKTLANDTGAVFVVEL